MTGGYGRIGGTVIGALIIGVLSNGLNLIGVSSFWQYIVKGIVILIAVYADVFKRKRPERLGHSPDLTCGAPLGVPDRRAPKTVASDADVSLYRQGKGHSCKKWTRERGGGTTG